MNAAAVSPLRAALARVSILDVWRAAGGGELRNGRGRAFWRDSHDFNVVVNIEKNAWFDFVSHEGGGVLNLVCTALKLTSGEAACWLVAFAGLEDKPMTRAARRERSAAALDAEDAHLFIVAAETLAEHVLEADSLFNSARADVTALIVDIRREPLAVFRQWRRKHPRLTRALVIGGRRELQRREESAALELQKVFLHGA